MMFNTWAVGILLLLLLFVLASFGKREAPREEDLKTRRQSAPSLEIHGEMEENLYNVADEKKGR